MNTPSDLSSYESEMLRFIMPPNNTVELLDTPEGYVRQHYVFHRSNPVIIIMREENILWEQTRSSFLYVFGVKEHDLILNSCTEKNFIEEATMYYNGYPYIRLPESYTQRASWDYVPCENIHVSCTSQFQIQEIEGKQQEFLLIERMVEYSDEDITEAYQVSECYIAGLGIQKKQMSPEKNLFV